MIVSDKIYIPAEKLGRHITELCHLFTYKNPQYYKNKKLKISVKGIPKTLCHFNFKNVNDSRELILPRGGLNRVKEFFKKNNIYLRYIDDRVVLPSIDCRLEDTVLEDQQVKIIKTLLENDGGLIQMDVAGGKTIAAIGYIAEIKQPTLILLYEHRLKEQWKEDIEKRLVGNYTLGDYSGGSTQDGDIVLGLVQTIHKKVDEDPSFLRKFGAVITDECLDPETIINVPEGLKLLKDIQIGDKIITPKGKVATVINVKKVRKQAYKYNLTRGNFLIGSKDHKVPTFKHRTDHIFVSKIENASRLLYPKVIPGIENIKNMEYTDDEYLLGLFIGDGTCDRNCIKFAYRRDANAMRPIFNKLGCFRESGNKRGDVIFTMEYEKTLQFKKKYNIQHGKKANTITIPEDLYKSCNIGVLKGIFDTDGCGHFKSGKDKQTYIELG